MKEYLVIWKIEIDAESPEDAAKKALAIQQNPENTATVFHVELSDDETIIIDAADLK